MADSETYEVRLRWAFWITSLVLGAISAFTTRYFLNGDAIHYTEMGQAFLSGDWKSLVNLTYSPGYPVLLGLAQGLLGTTPLNEVPWLKVVNLVDLTVAMISWEVLLSQVKKDVVYVDGIDHLPWPLILGLSYAMFLAAALVLVRVRLVNPDMLIMAIVFWATTTLLRIRRRPEDYLGYAWLGLILGLGYLVKSFFLPFSLVYWGLAGLLAGRVKMAIPRVFVAALVMALVSAPLMYSLSQRLGRFSYGELGKHVYAMFISGEGQPIHPEILLDSPKVVRYQTDIKCTRPATYDICYWYDGFRPKINWWAHLQIIPGNVFDVFDQTPWLWLIGLWLFLVYLVCQGQWLWPRPSSIFWLLMIPAVGGIGLYLLLWVEPRYLAPYLCLIFLGLILNIKIPYDQANIRSRILILTLLLASLFLGKVVHSLIDQGREGLVTTTHRLSYRDQFQDQVTLKNFLLANGLGPGDQTGVVGDPPIYWARLAGVKIVAEVVDEKLFLATDYNQRQKAVEAIGTTALKALVAKGSSYKSLAAEGWRLAPGTGDYYVLFLKPAAHPD